MPRYRTAEALIARRLREWELPPLDTSQMLDPDQHGASWLPLRGKRPTTLRPPDKPVGEASLQSMWTQNDAPHPIVAIWLDSGTGALIAQLYSSTGGKRPRVGKFYVEQRFRAGTDHDLILRTMSSKGLRLL